MKTGFYDRLGRPNGTHWHGGMISQIRQNEIDIAFTSIWIIETHHRYANLTESISVENIHFLVPRPKPYLSFWALTKPFTPIVWVIIIMMVIAQSLTVNARAHLFPLKVPKSKWRINILTAPIKKTKFSFRNFNRIPKFCHDVDRDNGTPPKYDITRYKPGFQDYISTLGYGKRSINHRLLEQSGGQINFTQLRKKVSRFFTCE